MMTFDFLAAKMKHSSWKSKMRGFIDGTMSMSESEAVSHRDCELGKWLYADGLSNYGTMPEMQELERIHQDLHAHVKEILSLKNSGDVAGAETRFHDLDASSDKIIGLLDILDKKQL